MSPSDIITYLGMQSLFYLARKKRKGIRSFIKCSLSGSLSFIKCEIMNTFLRLHCHIYNGFCKVVVEYRIGNKTCM